MYLLGGWFLPSVGLAHLGHVIQQAERYIKLDVSGYRVRVVVSLTLGAQEMSRVMHQADTDQNGWVSPGERDAYMALWGDGLREELRISVDGTLVEVLYGEAFMQPIGPVSAVDGAVEMVGEFVLDGGEHLVSVADDMPRDAFDRTDLSFRARDAATLLASGIGEFPTELTEHGSVHRDTPYPEAFSMRVRVPYRPRTFGERLRVMAPWIGLVVVLLGAALWHWLKRRDGPRSRR
ncbi:MAG: hypothetical protein R3B40_08925 [Polyangiales bacterium]|nr:hypothetical protein [Sandaracinaceae bacterium]